MARSRVVLCVEELDGRTVPSTLPVAVPLATAAGSVSVQHALAGSGKGTYTTGDAPPDVGKGYHLQGTGTFAALGQVTIHGSVNTPGFILNVKATGTLTFSGPKGSVTVALQGMGTSGSSSSLWFHYQVVHADGGFKQVTDQGTLRLDFTAAAPAPKPHGHGHGHLSQRGTFTVRI
jgi:hypothetical protein